MQTYNHQLQTATILIDLVSYYLAESKWIKHNINKTHKVIYIKSK